MHIHVRKLIRPTYLAWAFMTAFIFMTILSLMFYFGGRADVQKTIHEYTYMKDQRELSAVLTERDRNIKINDMYGRIHTTYGKKYHPRWNASDKWMHQGLSKEQRAEFFRLAYEYSRDLSLPYFSLITTSVVETGMNPIARTYKEVKQDVPGIVLKKDGKFYIILEAGIFQQRFEAVEHAFWVLENVMSPAQRRRYSFKFTKMEDLFDPINALKIAAILFYDAKLMYNSDPSWYVTSVHWGSSRIWKYFINGVMPPAQFVFNRGTVREDARSPFTYYFYWNAFNTQFEKFTTEVFIDEAWIDSYKKACSKQESLFIDMHKYVRKMIEITEARQQALDEYKIQDDRYRKAWEKKLSDVDNKYRELIGLMRRGKGRTAKDVFKEGFALFKGLADDMYSEKVDKMRKFMIITLAIAMLFIITLAGIGVYHLLTNPLHRLFKSLKNKVTGLFKKQSTKKITRINGSNVKE